jgi:hypothetical protein
MHIIKWIQLDKLYTDQHCYFYQVALNQSPCHISLAPFHSELYDANWGFIRYFNCCDVFSSHFSQLFGRFI